MRKRQTFLLTVLTTETEGASLCGRLKVISSGKSSNFSDIQELFTLITTELGEGSLQDLSGPNHSSQHSQDKYLPL